MRFTAALLLSFISSALSYAVIRPNAAQGWTNVGPQILAWTYVSTDPLNFTAVLVNSNPSIFPLGSQVLAALVNGTQDQIPVNPPSGGWPTGPNFRVNLVKDTNDLNTILAQSSEFEIKTPTSTSSSVLSIGSTIPLTVATTPVSPTTDVGGSTPSTTKPPTPNSAFPTLSVPGGLMSVLTTLVFFLA